MKRLLRIFELTKNEQRVVLIVVFALVAVAFARYESRLHRFGVQTKSVAELKPSATPVAAAQDDQ
jgi:hypothetical protein